jgi:hypothetical protein
VEETVIVSPTGGAHRDVIPAHLLKGLFMDGGMTLSSLSPGFATGG